MVQSAGNRTAFRAETRSSDVLIILNVHFLNLIIKKIQKAMSSAHSNGSILFG